MKISHILSKDRPSSIIVRNYDNKSIVHFPNYIIREYYKPLENEIGQFKIKYYNNVLKELDKFIEFEKL